MCQYRLLVRIPLPERPCWPNWVGHWAQKAAAKRKLRQAAKEAGLAARDVSGLEEPLAAANVTCQFHFPERRHRDKDNALAAMKAAFDGLQDAGIVENDTNFTYQPVTLDCDPADPRVDIIVEG